MQHCGSSMHLRECPATEDEAKSRCQQRSKETRNRQSICTNHRTVNPHTPSHCSFRPLSLRVHEQIPKHTHITDVDQPHTHTQHGCRPTSRYRYLPVQLQLSPLKLRPTLLAGLDLCPYSCLCPCLGHANEPISQEQWSRGTEYSQDSGQDM